MKILVVEDDPFTCEMLSAILRSHHYVVDTSTDGISALALASQWAYDLILLDILLPKLDGVEVCRRLRSLGCQTPILMMTVKATNEDIITGLDAGADDYVAKSCDSSQVLARVRALLRRRGNAALSPQLVWGQLCLDPVSAHVTYRGEVIALRPKEYNLLELFLSHPQRIFSRSTIIDHLWPIDDPPIEGSITNLIKDLRQRLKSAGMMTDLIETVYGLGYRLKPAPSETDAEQAPGVIEDTASVTTTKTEEHDNWEQQEHRAVVVIQNITEHFQASLPQRITLLEAAEESLQAGNFTRQQRDQLRQEIHKLAGGLGTFGYSQASAIAQSMEDLLYRDLSSLQLARQFTPMLKQLKQELVNPLIAKSTEKIPVVG